MRFQCKENNSYCYVCNYVYACYCNSSSGTKYKNGIVTKGLFIKAENIEEAVGSGNYEQKIKSAELQIKNIQLFGNNVILKGIVSNPDFMFPRVSN